MHSKTLIPAALLFAALPLLGETRSVTTSTTTYKATSDCGDVRVDFPGRSVARDTIRNRMPLRDAAKLDLNSSSNGGIRVVGWDKDEVEVQICKAAGGLDKAAAKAMLARVDTSFRDGKLHPSGPKDEPWVVHIVVRAPRGTTLNLRSENGEVDLIEFAGNATVTTTNGAVDLTESSGAYTVNSENGMVSIRADRGSYKVKSTNGLIQFHAKGDAWNGGNVTASSVNGALAVFVPKIYSAVAIHHGSGKVTCSRWGGCGEQQTSSDTVMLGKGAAAINLSTSNGGVQIY
jgi:DUF4097 and DUF4098 domain-containing protein YvlB